MQKVITHINFAKGFRGGERQTQLLIEQLSKKGFTQKLLVRKGSTLATRVANTQNLEIIELSKPYIFHLNAVNNSSILHAHETKALQFAYFASLLKKIPYIVTRRVDNKVKNNWLNKLLYQNAKYCVVLSSAIEKTILDITRQVNTVTIPSAFINTTINQDKTNQIKARFPNKFLIGHIGALDDKHKGQSLIIEIAKEIETKYKDIHFLLIGDGADKQKLKNMAQNLSNITFEGFVNNVPDYIAALDLFVFPSRNEGLGSTLLDVMNLNVAIVASRVGGIVDIIEHEKNGLLFDIENKKEFLEYVLELYKNKEKRENLAKNGAKKVQNYSVEKMTQSYIALYEKIISL